MSEDYEFFLTEKANFPETDATACAELATALGITMDFLDGLIRMANQDQETLNLWEIARGLQSASELYFLGKANGEKDNQSI